MSRGDCRAWKKGVIGYCFSFAGINGETGLKKAKGGRLPAALIQGREDGGSDRMGSEGAWDSHKLKAEASRISG